MAKALGIPLQMERTSHPMRYYTGRFADGPFDSADFRFNTDTGAGILVLTARPFTLSDVDFDALGEWPRFSGFDMLRPGELHELYVVDLDRRELRFREALSGERATLAIEWKRSVSRQRIDPCGEPPAKIPRLTAAHGFEHNAKAK